MKKKVLSIVLASFTAMSLMACGGNTKSDSKSKATSKSEVKSGSEVSTPTSDSSAVEPEDEIDWSKEDHVKLKMYFHGSNVTDDSKVLEELNAYLTEKLNCELEPIWGTWGDFDENAVLALQGADDNDIYFTCSWSADEYNKFAREGYFVRLDDPNNNLLDKYGKNMKNDIIQVLWDGAVTKGKEGEGIYAVPGYKDYAIMNCWDVNVDRLTELGFTTDDVAKGYYEFGPMLKAAKEKYGDKFYPLCIEGYVLERMVTNSTIITGDGNPNFMSYYLNPDDVSKEGSLGVKIANKFSTDEFKKFAQKTKEYYDLGYIDPAFANAQQANDRRSQVQASGEYLIGTQSNSFGYEKTASEERGITVKMVPCTEPYMDASSVQGAMFAVSTVSKNPERAVALLDLLTYDQKALTLLTYGVEGVHYNKNADGFIEFTEERNNYSPWRNGVGNITILPVQAAEATAVENGADYWKEFKDFYAGAKFIPIRSFVFDGSDDDIKAKMAAVSVEVGEYGLALCTGAVDDVDATISKLVDNMNKVGAQDVIDEVNKQLSDYLSEK